MSASIAVFNFGQTSQMDAVNDRQNVARAERPACQFVERTTQNQPVDLADVRRVEPADRLSSKWTLGGVS